MLSVPERTSRVPSGVHPFPQFWVQTVIAGLCCGVNWYALPSPKPTWKQRSTLEVLTLRSCGLFSCGGGTGRRSFLSFIWNREQLNEMEPLCVVLGCSSPADRWLWDAVPPAFPSLLRLDSQHCPLSPRWAFWSPPGNAEHFGWWVWRFRPLGYSPREARGVPAPPSLTFWAGAASTGCSLHLCSWSTKTWFVAPGPLLVWQLCEYYI